MPTLDRYGLALSTTSQAASEAYREGIDCILAAWPGADKALDLALRHDPDFALALAARARLHFTYAEPQAAREKAARARAIVAEHGSDRERSHVDIIALAIEGQPAKALERAVVHLESWPRDALILSMPLGAFGLYAFSGMPNHDQARVDLCERHARHYGEDWWFLTYLGWSHTENGSAGAGRLLTQRGFDLRRENANAAHALAHAMYEDGSLEDSERLIDDWLPCYDRSGILHGHIAWHQALLALEKDEPARALELYGRHIAPGASMAVPINAVTDEASLLWRAQLCGHKVDPALWQAVAENALRLFPGAGVAFADVHVAAAAAATGDQPALDKRIADLEKRLSDGKLLPGPVAIAICRAFGAFASGDYKACAAALEPAAAEVVRIGGSHAQRDMIEDTLLVALIKSGASERARALLDRRLHRRPSLRDLRWQTALQAA